ncbi:hypothetical protein [Coleofasciculus sp. E2-BRE-01]|uniref:hypothetical protein n=1 Tax=Coleofasciculus sp. E2-BRE-01 TaxID=3069524 RepID=UPI0032F3A257
MRSPVFLQPIGERRATRQIEGNGVFISASGSPLPDPRCFGLSLTGAIASGGDSYLTKFHPCSFPLANTTGKSINFLEEPASFVNPDSMVTWWVTADLSLNGSFPQFNTA